MLRLLLLNKAYIYKLYVCHCHVLLILPVSQETRPLDLVEMNDCLRTLYTMCDLIGALADIFLVVCSVWQNAFSEWWATNSKKGQLDICKLDMKMKVVFFFMAVNMFLSIENPNSRKMLKESGGNKEIQAPLSVHLLLSGTVSKWISFWQHSSRCYDLNWLTVFGHSDKSAFLGWAVLPSLFLGKYVIHSFSNMWHMHWMRLIYLYLDTVHFFSFTRNLVLVIFID